MRLTLLFSLLCFFTATEANQAHKLSVDMLNLGSDNCELTQSKILQGKMIEGTIPGMLPGSGQVFTFKIGLASVSSYSNAYTDAELQLTYQCGPDKHITLYMKQYYKKDHYHGQMIVNVVDSSYVHETHEVSAPERDMRDHSNSHPGHIRWTIWN